MTWFCSMCTKAASLPENWRNAIIVLLYKQKGSRSKCPSYKI